MAERSVNQVTLLGRLGKDAETKFTTSGAAKTTFSLATSRRWKDQQSGEFKEDTTWHNVVLWRSENLAPHLVKGKQVYVAGRIENRSYEKDGQKHYISEVVADDVILLGGREQAEGGPVSAPRSSRSAPTHRAPSYPDDTRLGDGVDPTDDEAPW